MNNYYERMRIMKTVKNDTGIPPDPEKVIFAEELVNYMMLKCHSTPYLSKLAGSNRKLIYNYFNDHIATAVKLMGSIPHDELEEIFQIMKNGNHVNQETFMQYASDIHKAYVARSFDGKKFLYFCAHIARLAADFYSEGVLEAPDFALDCILYSLQPYDMNEGGWDSLKLAAESFVSATANTSPRNHFKHVFDTVPVLESGDSSSSYGTPYEVSFKKYRLSSTGEPSHFGSSESMEICSSSPDARSFTSETSPADSAFRSVSSACVSSFRSETSSPFLSSESFPSALNSLSAMSYSGSSRNCPKPASSNAKNYSTIETIKKKLFP